MGSSDVERGTSLHERSLFRVSSASKIWVSVAFLTLVDEGRVALDDPVARHLPELDDVRVSDDGLRVVITPDECREGFVHELHLDGVKSASGEPVLHPRAYYTLSVLP